MTHTYLVIHGHAHTDKSAQAYVENIVYGSPEIDALWIDGSGHFVALCTYGDDRNNAAAKYTMERMGSFPHGCSLTAQSEVAFREFGAWIAHSLRTQRKAFAADTAATQNMVADMEDNGLL